MKPQEIFIIVLLSVLSLIIGFGVIHIPKMVSKSVELASYDTVIEAYNESYNFTNKGYISDLEVIVAKHCKIDKDRFIEYETIKNSMDEFNVIETNFLMQHNIETLLNCDTKKIDTKP